MKRIGIIGGLGPETSSMLCLRLNNRIRAMIQRQPDIVLENLAVTLEVERSIIHGNINKTMKKMLINAVARLNSAMADFIIIPCNTVHVFIDDLRRVSKIPLLSIMEECANVCKNLQLKKVGILGSSTTINSNLHHDALRLRGIDVINPSPSDQKRINCILLRIIHNNTTKIDKKILLKIMNNLIHNGAEGIILGCTDLPLLLKDTAVGVPIIDTTNVLENAAIRQFLA